MKNLLTAIFTLFAIAALAQQQADSLSRRSEYYLKKYKGQEKGAIILGACSGGLVGTYFVVRAYPPTFTYTNTSTGGTYKQAMEAYNRRVKQWRNAKTGLLVSGLITGAFSIIIGVKSGVNKKLYENTRIALGVSSSNAGIGLCLQFK